MSGTWDLRRLEQRMTYVRCFAIVFAVASLATNRDITRAGTVASWTLIALLAVGTSLIWARVVRAEARWHRLVSGLPGWGLDAAIVAGLVWLSAGEDPYLTWALLLLVPIEGALRYGGWGAGAGATFVAVFFVGQTLHVAQVRNEAFDSNTYVFVVALSTLVAGVTGTMANMWLDQKAALDIQRLKLAEIDKLKDRFLAVTSHEIRGPLTAIIAGIDALRKRSERMSPEQTRAMLTMVSAQAAQLGRLVDDLKVTSQLQSHQLALQAEWADLGATIDQAIEAAASKRRNHQLEVFVEPVRCEIDASRFGQIVRNLVENAYKYTPDRTRVSITARAVREGIALEVSDEGDGIPVDKRSQLFEAFSRIEETSAGREGVGLGLYVVSQLVAAMGGRIDLSSSSRGTTFTIAIPCDKQPVGRRQIGVVSNPERATG